MKPATLFLVGILLCATSASAQNWRLKEKKNHSFRQFFNDFRAVDSTTYLYDATSNRTSTYNNDSIEYDEEIKYVYYLYDMQYSYNIKRWYDTANRLLLSDKYTPGAPGTTKLAQRDSFVYTPSGQIKLHQTFMVTDTSSNNSGKYVFNLVLDEFYNYDAQGRAITKDSTVSLSQNNIIVYRHQYIYDASGNLAIDSILISISAPFVGWRTERFQYNAAGDVTNQNIWLYTGVGSVGYHTHRHPYLYDASGRLTSDTLIYKEDDTLSGSRNITSYSYNVSGLLKTDTMIKVSNYVPSRVYDYGVVHRYVYTSFGYLDTVYTQTYRNSGGGDTTYVTYRYEPHWPVSTSTVAKGQNDLLVYPVPSSNFINLKWTVDKPTTINARIVNLQGQVVKQWNDKADGIYTKSIHVGELPAGNYIVVLDAGKEQVSRAIVISK